MILRLLGAIISVLALVTLFNWVASNDHENWQPTSEFCYVLDTEDRRFWPPFSVTHDYQEYCPLSGMPAEDAPA